MTHQEALMIAKEVPASNGFRLDEEGNEVNGGWLFGWIGLTEELDDVPDGPSPIFVGEDGSIETVLLPSERGFEILDSLK